MIEVLLSTMFNKIDEEFFLKKNISSKCTVINQGEIESTEIINNNKVINSITSGLSVSRNLAMENATEEIAVISDDDLVMSKDYEDIVKKYYKLYPDADVITFLITMGNRVSDRIGSTEVKKHTRFSILQVGSNQITFRRKSLIDNNIKFNTYFGLGSNYFISGEENLLLKECFDKGLKMYHVPIVIANHIEAKASNAIWNESQVISKSAFFRLYHKNLYLLFMVYLYVVKRPIIDPSISFFKYLKLCFKGKEEFDKIIDKQNNIK